MKYTVPSNITPWLIILSTSLFFELVRSETICDCKDPPGGRVTCEDGQMAVCKVKDGKVEARCITPPQAAKESDDTLKAWVLGQVLGRPLRVEDIRLDRQMKDVLQKDQCEDPDKRLSDILKRGQYFNPAKRELIRFRLPAGK